MRRPASTWRILVVCLLVATTGCHPTQPFYLHGDGDLSHYLDKATHVETPDLAECLLADIERSQRPLSLSHPEFKEFWDLTLQDCVSVCLANSKVFRGAAAASLQNGTLIAGTREGGLLSSFVSQGHSVGTVYDPALVETNPGITQGGVSQFLSSGAQTNANGQSTDGGVANVRQGVEAALSEFDAQLSITGSPFFSTTDRPQNVSQALGSVFPTVQRLQNGDFNVEVAKRTAEGTLFRFSSLTDSVAGNIRGFNFANPGAGNQPLFGVWTQTLQAEVRQPLLQGRGAQINRMPIILARLGTDIELTNLQGNLQDMLNNIEIRYWDLYLAYRNLETAKVARDSALVTWRIVYDKQINEVEPIQAEAQAREQYYNFRSSMESALRSLYDNENELRFLMGLGPSDGRLIRPKDDPSLAQVEFDWGEILAEGIARRPELVQQRWRVKQREMELILARNQLLPRLDVGAQYRWLGVGDSLIHADRNGIPFKDMPTDTGKGSTAWEELTGGKYQEFSLLFQYQMPIGFRRELAGVRHAQLRLAREKAFLEDMELDVAHGLAHAVRNLDTNFHLSQSNANRWFASQTDVNARQALYEGGRAALDDVLEAQRRRALAQGAFWQSVIEYNKSICDLHTRKGSIMEYDGIGFEEGPWPQKAYWDALARARQRDAALYIDYGWTRPRVISRGPIPQTAAEAIGSPVQTLPAGPGVEELPTPQPTPAKPPTDGTEISPTPEPKVLPQEIRRRPPPAAPQVNAASPAPAGNLADPDSAPAASLRPVRPVRPASYSSEWSASANPLRGNQPIGTGVADWAGR